MVLAIIIFIKVHGMLKCIQRYRIIYEDTSFLNVQLCCHSSKFVHTVCLKMLYGCQNDVFFYQYSSCCAPRQSVFHISYLYVILLPTKKTLIATFITNLCYKCHLLARKDTPCHLHPDFSVKCVLV